MTWGVTGLVVRYGDVTAVDGVDLEVSPGRVVCVVGGDGAGKTSLLRALAGGLPPAAGEVRSPGRRRTGFMPTSGGVWADLSVDENIDFVANAYGVGGHELDARRTALLEGTGLGAARRRLGGQLSGGMRQKLAFGLATLHSPELLVLDEPTTGVDPISRGDLWRMISRAAADGAAVVLATTYLDEAERTSQVTVLDAGRVLLSGPPAQVAASAPGTVVRLTGAPDGRHRHAEASAVPDAPAGLPSWRRGAQRHAWVADGDLPPGAEPLQPDLEDAVIAATLAQEATRG